MKEPALGIAFTLVAVASSVAIVAMMIVVELTRELVTTLLDSEAARFTLPDDLLMV